MMMELSNSPSAQAMLSNGIVVSLLALGGLAARAVLRNELWRAAFARVLGLRRWSIVVLSLYVAVALLDSVVWVGGSMQSEDQVASFEARSVIDRLFVDTTEKGYSAPMARVEFYDKSPLLHPQRHLLGTN
ncbi:MAG TPA: hypothetical protein VN764_07480, partial [Polyangiaceae bacterium]|nr:hypothetical protein [Polyangiaceae bacterium]